MSSRNDCTRKPQTSALPKSNYKFRARSTPEPINFAQTIMDARGIPLAEYVLRIAELAVLKFKPYFYLPYDLLLYKWSFEPCKTIVGTICTLKYVYPFFLLKLKAYFGWRIQSVVCKVVRFCFSFEIRLQLCLKLKNRFYNAIYGKKLINY